MASVQDTLDKAQPHSLPDMLRKLGGFGAMLAGMRPRSTARTGLTSQATHVHPYAAAILSVDNGSGGPLAIVTGSAAGAGEVRVDYDATTGVPTLTFGDGATTAYSVTEVCVGVPQTLAATMAADGQSGS